MAETTETKDGATAPTELTPTEVKYRNWLAQKLRTDEFWIHVQERMFGALYEVVEDECPEEFSDDVVMATMAAITARMINAGMEAIAHFTMNTTMEPKGILMSTMRTGEGS